MATTSELLEALRRADAAGDTAAATRLAELVRASGAMSAPTQAEPTKEGGFFSSLWESAAQTPKIAAAATRYAADQSEANRKALIEAGKSEYSQLNWDDVHNISDFWKYFKTSAGSSLGQMIAPALAGAGVGALTTGATASTIVGAPASPIAGLIAGRAAYTAVSSTQYAAQEALRHAQQAEEDIRNGKTPTPLDLGKVAVASLASGSLDAFEPTVFKGIFSKLPFVKKLVGAEGKAASKEATDALVDAYKNKKLTYSGGIAKGVGKGVAFEIPQEIAQQALERWSVNLSLTDDDAIKEYKEAAIGAAILGGAAGSVEGFVNTHGKRLQAAVAMQEEEEAKKAAQQGTTQTAGASPPAAQPGVQVLSDEEAALQPGAQVLNDEEAALQRAEAQLRATEAPPAGEAATIQSVVGQAATQAKAQEQETEARKAQAQQEAAAQAQAQQQPAAQAQTQDPQEAAKKAKAQQTLRDLGLGQIADLVDIPPQELAQALQQIAPNLTKAEREDIAKAQNTLRQYGFNKLADIFDIVRAQGAENVETRPAKPSEVATQPDTAASGASTVLPVSQEAGAKTELSEQAQQPRVASVEPSAEAAPTREVGVSGALKTTEDVKALPHDQMRSIIKELVGAGKITYDQFKTSIGLLENIDEGIITGRGKIAAAKKKVTDLVSTALGVEKVAPTKGRRVKAAPAVAPAAQVQTTPAATTETKAEPTDFAKPTEDEIYSADDKKLEKLLYEATYDKEADAREGGIPEEDHDKYVSQLKGIKKLPTKEQFSLRTKIGDAIAKAHGYLTDEDLMQKGAADMAGTVENVEGLAPKRASNAKQLDAAGLREHIESNPDNSNLINLMRFVRETADNPLYRILSARFAELMSALQRAGVTIDPVRYRSLPDGAVGMFSWGLIDENKPFTAKNIWLSITLGEGANYGTLVHEFVHSVFVPMRTLGRSAYNEYKRYIGTIKRFDRVANVLDTAFKEIKESITKYDPVAIDAVRKKYGNEAVDYILKDLETSEEGAALIDGNAFDGPDEAFAWALSSPRAWGFAELIPYKSDGRVSKVTTMLARIFAQLMGLSNKFDTALEGVLRVTAELTNTDGGLLINMLGKKYKDIVFRKRPMYMATRQAAVKQTVTPEEIVKQGTEDVKRFRNKKKTKTTVGSFFSASTYENVVTKLVDSRRALQRLQRQIISAGKIKYSGDFNNFYDLISIRAALSVNYIKQRLENKYVALDNAVQDLVKASKMSVDEIIGTADRYLKSLHVNERRDTKFMMFSPLNDTKKNFRWTDENGNTTLVGAATLRYNIWKSLYENPNISEATVDNFRTILKDLTKDGSTYLDINGLSLSDQIRPGTGVKPGKWSINRNDNQYNVLAGYDINQMLGVQLLYKNDPHKDKYDAIIAAVRKIQEETKALDKEANYWSKPVENISRLYDWKNYVPFTGKNASNISMDDDLLEFDSSRLGSVSELDNSVAAPFGGRKSESDNVILAIQAASARAAGRLAQKPSVQALANASKQKLLGAKFAKNVKFADRLTGIELALTDPQTGRLLPSNAIFIQYKDDGSIDIYKFTKKSQRDALRRAYKEPTIADDIYGKLNSATSFIGRNYTRFNIDFGPKNFIRDTFTNLGVISAEKGLGKGANYLWNITSQLATFGWARALNAARLFEKNDMGKLATLGRTDDFYKGAHEFLSHGGDVTLLSAYLTKTQQEKILESHLKNKGGFKWAFGEVKDVINHVFDVWGRSFELSARVAAFNMEKAELMAKGVPAEEAMYAAAAYAKELANFEKKSEFSKKAGAMYMFFRPSAISAVRNMDALRPIFIRDVNSLMYDAPMSILTDPAAMDKAKKELAKARMNAWATVIASFGLGTTVYMIIKSMAGDDDEGRNVVASDDMSQWARSIRIPTTIFGGEDPNDMIQIPFGFGLGAFSAMGAQIAATAAGHQPVKDLVWNSVTIGLDSFIPLPIARFNPFEGNLNVSPSVAFTFWMLESAAPSIGRPFLEWTNNSTGLGQEIGKRTTTSKYGDAYLASETVPEMYNDLAKGIEKLTNGGIDLEPGELRFMMNAYTSAAATLASDMYGLSLLATGDKDFVAKDDIPGIGGFVGKRPSPDPRVFYKNVNEIKKLTEEMNKINSGIERGDESFVKRYLDFEDKYPDFESFSKEWNSSTAQLNMINKELKDIKAGMYGQMPPNERKAQVKILEAMRDGTMRDMNALYLMYQGKDPYEF